MLPPAGQTPGLRLSLSQLYGSSVAVTVVCQAVCQVAMTRVLLCRDLLILQQLYLRVGDNVSGHALTRITRLHTGTLVHVQARTRMQARSRSVSAHKHWHCPTAAVPDTLDYVRALSGVNPVFVNVWWHVPPHLLPVWGPQVFLGGGGQLLQLQQDLIPRTSLLLCSYYLLKWASQCLSSPVPLDTL